MTFVKHWPAILLLAWAWSVHAAETNTPATNRVLFAEHFLGGKTNGWENLAYFKPKSDYRVLSEGTNFFVRGISEKTCSGFSHKLNLEPTKELKLRWRWRVAGVNTNASDSDIKKFDHAARVFVAFDTFIGTPRTLNYFWGNADKAGTVREHPKSGRAHIFVLQSPTAPTNQWVWEERDLRADWKRVFGDREMPKIIGIGLMTDSDSLGQRMQGDYADIELSGQ